VQANFQTALAATLAEEGGYSNNPHDPGGSTLKGVTQGAYNAYRAGRKEPEQDVRRMTPAECADIYKTMYWDKVAGDRLPAGLDLATFDAAVNTGPVQGARFLQRALNEQLQDPVDDDGDVGTLTIAAAESVDAETAIDDLCEERLAYCRRLSTWREFGVGWTARVLRIQAKSDALARALPG
jgi:lysozyme family protein